MKLDEILSALQARQMQPAEAQEALRSSSGSPAAPCDGPGCGGGTLEDEVAASLAEALFTETANIDRHEPFLNLGVDSIIGVEWVRALNRRYGLSIGAARIYDYPTVRELTSFLREEMEKRVASNLPAPDEDREPAPRENLPTAVEIVPAAIGPVEAAAPLPIGQHLEGIAIIGLSGQFPKAKDVAEFWENLVQGRDCISEVPGGRWPIERFYDPDPNAAGKTYSRWMGVLEEADLFDPLFFNISPAEAELMDPQQRLFLQNCWHCIEDSGLNAADLSGSRCGVYVGCGAGDYGLTLDGNEPSAQMLMGSSSSILAARISYFLNLKGPSLAINTACSSSLVAIAQACDGLLLRRTDLALAGGVCVLAGPGMHIMTSRARMLSKSGRCYTFDDRADGFVPAEGVGVILLKRLPDAIRDGDPIRGVIRGWGVNQDGKTNGISAPSVNSQITLEKEVYRNFDIDPATISMVEAHGTGTSLGDPIEVEALSAAFRASTNATKYCALGSAKSNIGHALTAAGVAGVIKAVLALQHRMLPPTIHYEQLNRHIALDDGPFYINTELQPWLVEAGFPRRAAISSFGFSGTNAHLVIEEYPGALPARATRAQITTGVSPLFVLSARSQAQLSAYAAEIKSFIEARPALALADLNYTLQVGRKAMDHRMAFVAQSRKELLATLEAFTHGTPSPDVFAGQISRGKEAVLDAVEDVRLLLQTWIERKRWAKIAESWVKGLGIDWERMYGEEKPGRISAPGYPFERERYWIGAGERKGAGAGERHVGVGEIHPMVQRNTSSLSGQRYSGRFTGAEFFLADHVVGGSRVMPGAGYLEMARVALEEAWEVRGGPGRVVRMKQVVWARPLRVGAEGVEVHIGVYGEENGETGWEVYREEGEVYAQGRGEIGEGAEPPRVEVERLREQCREGEREGAECYEEFEEAGLKYGRGHRGLKKLWWGRDEGGRKQALARLELEGGVKGYGLHPGLVDSALQAAIGLRERRLEQALMPFTVEQVEVYGACQERGWAWVRYSAGSGEEEEAGQARLDVDVCDEQGQVWVALRGLTVRGLDGGVRQGGERAERREGWEVLKLAAVWDPVGEVAAVEPRGVEGPSVVVVGASAEQREWLRQGWGPVVELESQPGERVEEIANQLGERMEELVWVVPEANPELDSEAMVSEQERGVMYGYRLMQALLKRGYGKRELSWTVITTQTQAMHGGDAIYAAHAGVVGLMGSVAKEYPRWKVRVADVEAGQRWPVEEMRGLPGEGEVYGWRRGQWHRARLVEWERGEPEQGEVRYKRGGVYVVIGGAGGVGEAWSEAVIREYGARVVWIGRQSGEGEIERKRERLGRLGPKPDYVRADARGRGELEEAFEEIRKRHGGIDGVVHSALVLADRSLGQMEEERFRSALMAKVEVSVRMAQAVGREELDFVLFFSSIQSYAKAAGQSNYAAGCTFKDAYGEAWGRRSGYPVKVMNWGYWGSVGAVKGAEYRERMEQVGIGSLEPDEGMEGLAELVGSGRRQMAVVKARRGALEGKPWMGGASGEVLSVARQRVRGGGTGEEGGGGVKSEAPGGREWGDLEGVLRRVLGAQLRTLGVREGEQGSGDWPEMYRRWLRESRRMLGEGGGGGERGEREESESEAWAGWEAEKGKKRREGSLEAAMRLAETALRSLPEVVSGKREATGVLFPNGSMELVEGIYKHNRVADYFNQALAENVAQWVEGRLRREPGARVRIVELGAGTGGASEAVLERLGAYGESLEEYCYTDLSQGFLRHAERKYGAGRPYLRYRVLDVERGVREQGMEGGSYDVAIASNVLHATRDIREAVRHAKALLKRGGVLVLNEIVGGSLFAHVTFGLLEGWWRYRDGGIRVAGSPALTSENWKWVLEAEGFVGVRYPAAEARGLEQQVIVAESDGVIRQSRVGGGRERRQLGAAESAGAGRKPEGELREKVRGSLLETVSEMLKVRREEIEAEAELSEYGFDSIGLTELSNVLRQSYGVDVLPTVFFEYPTLEKLAGYLVEEHGETLRAKWGMGEVAGSGERGPEVLRARRGGRGRRGRSGRSEAGGAEPVAIIGMSGRFPGAEDVEALWRNLAEGRDCIGEVPRQRWDWEAIYGDPRQEVNKTNIKWGGFMEGVEEFDPLFFGISPREAERMDPQQRLLMTYVWKAIEDAGYAPHSLSGTRTAIYVGTGNSGYGGLLQQAGMEMEGYTATGTVPSVGPNRISYLLNLHGPSEPIETACSSSLVAIHRGMQSIAEGPCEMAIVGGVNTLLTPSGHISFSKAGMLSPEGRCKTFSAEANGYVRGEGVGVLVLKRLTAAERDRDHIYGVVRGSAENHGGRANSLTAPNPVAQAEVIREAYRKAGIEARSVSYIEAHGTGTVLGDPVEIEGLKSAFEEGGRGRGGPYCGIGSVKTNIGHLELAAGVAGVIKVLLQMRHRTLVRSLHCERINPYIQLEGSPFYLVREKREWEAQRDAEGREQPRRAGVSSFGFGGVNAHVVLEEYVGKQRGVGELPPALIVLSAKNPERLKEQARQLAKAIGEGRWQEEELGQLAYTLQVGREGMEHRVGLVGGSLEEVGRKLEQYVEGRERIEGLYRGEVKANKEALSAFAADEEMGKTIEAWMAKGKYSKLLELWVKGLGIDWERMYGEEKPGRISAPGYPFERERYWIGAGERQGVGAGERHVGAGEIHPMVQRNTSSLSGQRYSGRFTGAEFFLADHEVGGSRVMPGAGYLEMARVALEEAWEVRGGPGRVVRMKQVVWARPLRVGAEGVEVHIGVYGEENGETGWEVYREVGAGEEVEVYAQGRGEIGEGAEAPRVDVEGLRKQCKEGEREGAECYEEFEEAGLKYGRGHRGLKKVWWGRDEGGRKQALARLELEGGVKGYGLHPGLVDSALQAAIGLRGTRLEQALAPFTVEQVEVYGACQERGWAWVRYSAGSGGEEAGQARLDVDVCGEQGQVWVALRGLTARALEGGVRQGAERRKGLEVLKSVGAGSKPEGELREKVRGSLLETVSEMLKVRREEIEVGAELSEYGFDSIGLTELSNVLRQSYGVDVLPTVFFEYPTLEKLAGYLAEEHGEALRAKWGMGREAGSGERQKEEAGERGPEVLRARRGGRGRRGRSGRSEAGGAEPVAIIGMSGRFPGAEDVEALWRNLAEGRDCIGEVPRQRWDWEAIYGDPRQEVNKTNIKWGGFMEGVEEFDPLFFGISPREAERMDPQQRLLMTYVWKAIEDAGYAPHSLSGTRTAIYVGTGNSGYGGLLQQAGMEMEGYTATGTVPSVGPNRISYLLNLHGPSEPIETACSSSLVAIHRGMQSIAEGPCEMAIVGGVNTLLTPSGHISFSKAGMLSPEGRCKTFSAEANGYVRGEGVGVLVLKRLTAAERDRDHIYGVVRGSAENHGGRANSLTAPNPVAQAEVIREAYRKAGIEARSVSYIEAHGTGTVLGDPVEIEGLKSAFEEGGRGRGGPYCGIGSVKTNIGHLELAAGVAGVIKVLLQMRHRTLVRSLHCERINPYIQLEGSPFYLVREKREWEAQRDAEGREQPRRAGVSSFGFGGVNAHVVLEEYVGKQRGVGELPPALIVLSAKNPERLKEQARQLAKAIGEGRWQEEELGQLAYTLQVGREGMEHRVGLVGGSLEEVGRKLEQYVEGRERIEGLYRGEVKANKEALSAFAADEEMGKTIEAWMAKGKYSKLLELWVKGLGIDWERMYGEEKPGRISAPGYPFERERYWIGAGERQGVGAGERHVGAGEIHPMVQRNTSSLSGQRYSGRFTGAEFFLADHEVGGSRVMPGAGYLEMARVALEEAWEVRGGPGRVVRMKQVVWARPLRVGAEGVEVHIGVYGEENGETGWEVYREVGAGEEVEVYAQGRGEIGEGAEAPRVDVEGLRKQCKEGEREGAECYEEFEEAGLKYGRGHRGLKKVWWGRDEGGRKQALARLELEGGVKGYGLHPGLVDSALQAAIGLRGTRLEQALAPFTVEQVEVYGACQERGWAWVRYSAGSGGEEAGQARLDVDVCGEQGQVWVALRGLTARALEFQSAQASAESPTVMTFEEQWEPEALSPLSIRNVRSLVCFVSNPDNQKKLADTMRTLDPEVRLIFVARGDAYVQHSPNSYTVARHESGSYRDALAAAHTEHGSIDAVLYLWPIEDSNCVAGTASILYILQAAAAIHAKSMRILLAGQVASTLDRAHLEAWIGFDRSVQCVLPQTQVAVVLSELRADGSRTEMADWIRILWEELRADVLKSALYRGDARHICRIRSTHLEGGHAVLRPQGTYMITGGCGGLGLLFARHLAERYQANLVLTGRSPLDDARGREIARLESVGARVLHLKADVSDRARMLQALEQAEERFGAIHGVIHAAGVRSQDSVLDKTSADFERVLEPKVKGTVLLEDLCGERVVDFICHFSSSSAILGDFGSCDYAVGNRFQMALSQSRYGRSRRSPKTLAIGWPMWQNGGMDLGSAERTHLYLKSSGQSALETGPGLDLFERLLGQPGGYHLVIVGEPARVHHFLGISEPARVAERLSTVSAGRGRSPHLKGLPVQQCLAWDLKEHASQLLKIAREKLDPETNLADFGFDSMGLIDFGERLSRYYALEITPSVFFSHPTLTLLAEYFMAQHGAALESFYEEPISRPAPVASQPSGRVVRSRSGAGRPRWNTLSRGVPEPIAIVGMSGRFPQARSVDELWSILHQGRHVVQQIPEDRWPGTDGRALTYNLMGIVPGVAEFDPLFFEISPRDAEAMDPRQRLLLQESWKALEDANYGAARLAAGEIGMFVGVEQGDYASLVRSSGTGSITSNHDGVLASRLAYFLNLGGPAMAINTACSSGLVAAHQACLSLRANECDAAIAAGVNLLLTPNGVMRMNQAGMLSPDGICYAFDKRANGLVPGEAVVAVVLKRLSRAREDGDRIHAVIRGSGINYDGKTNGITAPSGAAQARLLSEIFDRYQIDPERIEYIVTHGTGTKLGDPVEINALRNAFEKYTSKQAFCALTSTKSNFGHTMAASGLLSLVSLVQALRHGTIPASLHCEDESDYIDWKTSPFYVNKANRAWPQGGGAEGLGAVSAFGLSGTNAHMVVQAWSSAEETRAEWQTPPCVLLSLSAKSEEALQRKIAEMLTFVQQEARTLRDLCSLSYTLLAGRQHFAHRCAIVVEDVEGAVAAWRQAGGVERPPNVFRGTVPRSFTGQKVTYEYANSLFTLGLSHRGDRQRYREILLALGDLYCQGYDLDWERMYEEEKPGRISAPGYPFERERYWIGAGERQGVGAGEIHPMVQRNTSSLSGQRYSGRFTGAEFFLADHVVGGSRVMPGAGYLEMARVALEEAWEVRGGPGRVVRMKQVVWARPLRVGAEGVEVHIGVYGEENGETGWEVYREEGEVYAQGRGEIGEGAEPPRVEVERLREQCREGEREGAECYEEFEEAGLKYGRGHRGLKKLWWGRDEGGRKQALARLELEGGVKGYGLHPGLVDSALQAAIGLRERRLEQALMPFTVEQVEVYGACQERGWAWVRYSAGSGEEEEAGQARLDVDVCDEQGQVWVALRGLTVRGLDGGVRQGGERAERREGWEVLKLAAVWDPVGEVAAVEPRGVEGPSVVVVGASAEQREWLRQGWGPVVELESQPGERVEEIANQLGERMEELVWVVPEANPELDSEAMVSEQERGVMYGYRLMQALLKRGYGKRELSWTVITTQTQAMHGGDAIYAAHAGVVGLMGSVAKEYPRWKVRVADVEAGQRWPVEEMRGLPGEGEVYGWRRGQWHRARLVEWERGEPEQGEVRYKRGGVYVVIGGAGGVGEAWSEAVIREYGARVVWIGRQSGEGEIERKRERLGRLGPKPDYVRADARGRGELEEAFEEIRKRHGGIDGVVHSALVLADRSLGQMEEERFRSALMAKVEVSVRMAQAVGREELDFVLFFSSIQSYAKAAGQSNYAAGCTFKDAYGEAWGRRSGYPVKVMNWGYWGSVGAVKGAEYRERMEQVGIGSLEPDEGMEGLAELVGSGRRQMAVVKARRGALEGKPWMGGASGEVLSVARQRVRGGGTGEEGGGGVKSEAPGGREWGDLEGVLRRVLGAQLRTLGVREGEQGSGDWPEMYRRWLRESRRMLGEGGGGGERGEREESESEAWAGWEAEKGKKRREGSLEAAMRLAETALRSLPEVVSGKREATGVLFPNGSMELVEGIYKHNRVADYFNQALAENVAQWVEGRLRREPGARVRIVELGAGTGGASEAVLERLGAYGESLEEYCYTDLSQGFLRHAERKYGAGRPYLRYRVLDVERGVREQGMEGGSYDVAIASNVLHATRDIREAVRHAKALLKRGGVLVLNEIVGGSLFAHVTFGLLEGWWRYRDGGIRVAGSPALTSENWKWVLEAEGFVGVRYPAAEARGLEQQVIVAESDGVIRQSRVGGGRERRQLGAAESAGAGRKPEGELREKVRGSLLETVSEMLKVRREEIEAEAELSEYGFDSIGLTELSNVLRQSYGVDVLPTVFFEYPTLEKLAGYLVEEHGETLRAKWGMGEVAGSGERGPEVLRARRGGRGRRARSGRSEAGEAEPVAIIGMSGRFPGAEDVEALWRNLAEGRDCIGEVPRQRWDHSQYYDPDRTKADKTYSRWGGFIDNIPDEPRALFLQVVTDLLLGAGHTGEVLRKAYDGNVGVYLGATSLITDEITNSAVANGVSAAFDLHGPSLAVDSMSSSSMTALHMACGDLFRGDCDAAIVGGVSLLNPKIYLHLSRLKLIGSHPDCRSFADGDGFLVAECAGAVLLKRLSRAMEDGDPILAVVRSTAANAAGYMNGTSVPNLLAQTRLIENNLLKSRIDPRTITYVEAAANGLPVGDSIEFAALTKAFRKFTSDHRFCAIGSVEAIIGHAIGASGMAQLIKVLLQMRHQTLVPVKPVTVNPRLNFNACPFFLPRELQVWARPVVENAGKRVEIPRRALINSFGAGGSYANVILEEYPPPPTQAVVTHDSVLGRTECAGSSFKPCGCVAPTVNQLVVQAG